MGTYREKDLGYMWTKCNGVDFPWILNPFLKYTLKKKKTTKKVVYETTGEGEHCGCVILMNDCNFF